MCQRQLDMKDFVKRWCDVALGKGRFGGCPGGVRREEVIQSATCGPCRKDPKRMEKDKFGE